MTKSTGRKKEPLTEDESKRRLKIYNNGLSDKEIASKVGVSREAIWEWRERRSLPPNYISKEVDEKIFRRIDSKEKAYVVGFWIGDGFARSDSGYAIGFRQDDRSILEEIRSLLNSQHSIYSRKDGYDLHIYSKELFEALSSNFDQPITERITQLPKVEGDLESHLIRGLFDADGCISLDKKDTCSQVEFSISGVENLLEEVREILESELGLSGVSVSKGDCTYQLKYAGNNQTPKIMQYLYENASLFINSKKEKWVNLKRKYCNS